MMVGAVAAILNYETEEEYFKMVEQQIEDDQVPVTFCCCHASAAVKAE